MPQNTCAPGLKVGTDTSSHHPTIFLCVLISLHDANLPEQVIMGVGFVKEQVVIMIGYAETVTM